MGEKFMLGPKFYPTELAFSAHSMNYIPKITPAQAQVCATYQGVEA